MKKAFLLLCALLLALGSALPLAGYRLAQAVLGRRADVSPAPRPAPLPYRKPRLPLSRETQTSFSSKI